MAMWALIFIFIVLCIVGFSFLSIYNRLVRLKNQVQKAWANIDVILKQRFDEIPQLIQVIEQYASYEAGLLKSLADARRHYGSAQSVGEKIEATKEFNVALRGVAALGEAYPELKANENFNQLQSRISDLENMLADRRELYNEAVTIFNTRIEQVPDVFIANFLNYQRQRFFEVDEADKVRPNLKLDLPKFNTNP